MLIRRTLLAFLLFIAPALSAPTQENSSPTTPLTATARNGILHLRYAATAGLGNRLKKNVSYLRYYQPRHLNLYWPDKGWVSARFSDLFRPAWLITYTEYNSPVQINKFRYAEPLIPYVNEYALLITRDDFADGNALLITRDDFADGKPFRIDTKYNQIPEHIRQIYHPYFAAIKPAPAVQKRIDAVRLPQNAVAVQVRNAPDWAAHGHNNEPAEKFFATMDKFPPDTVFFLSAMSAETAAPFHKRYAGRIFELPDKDYRSMVDAAADMFLLGRTKAAIYSYGSTFAEVGWWLGGAKSDVVIIGMDTPEKILIDNSQLRILQNATRRSRFFLRLPRISPFTQVPLALKADFFAK